MGRGLGVAALVLSSSCLLNSQDATDVFYGTRYESEHRGELISFAAEDPKQVRVLIAAEDDQYFGEPNWLPSADAFDVVKERDGQQSIQRVTTEWVSVETRVELGELQVVHRRLYRTADGEQLFMLTRDESRNHLSRVDASGQMSEVVDLALFGLTSPEACHLHLLSAQRVAINCRAEAGNAPMVTVVDVESSAFETYWPATGTEVGSVFWAPDSSAFAFCSGDAALDMYTSWLVRLEEGRDLAQHDALELREGCPQVWSPDSRWLATTGYVHDLLAQDVASPALELEIDDSIKPGRRVPRLHRFSPDSRRLAYGEIASRIVELESDAHVTYDGYGGGYHEPSPIWSRDARHLYRGSCAEDPEFVDWRCRGTVFEVDALFDGCAEEDDSPRSCEAIAPGLNASTSIPEPWL